MLPTAAAATVLESYRLTLGPLFRAAAGETLAFAATSDNPELARARVEGGELVVEVVADGPDDGVAEVSIVATDGDGLTATLRFAVAVEFLPASSYSRGWRLTLDRQPP